MLMCRHGSIALDLSGRGPWHRDALPDQRVGSGALASGVALRHIDRERRGLLLDGVGDANRVERRDVLAQSTGRVSDGVLGWAHHLFEFRLRNDPARAARLSPHGAHQFRSHHRALLRSHPTWARDCPSRHPSVMQRARPAATRVRRADFSASRLSSRGLACAG